MISLGLYVGGTSGSMQERTEMLKSVLVGGGFGEVRFNLESTNFLELFGLPFTELTTEELTHEFAVVVGSISEITVLLPVEFLMRAFCCFFVTI